MSSRLTHISALCAALVLLAATQSHKADARPQSDSMPYHGLEAHGGLEAVLIDAFSYTPFAGRDLEMPTAANIVVNYTGFTPQAQAAFQHAVNIWAAIISSPVTIVVDASFANLAGATLGQAGASVLRRNFPGAPVANTWFPGAVANRIAGADLDPLDPDIEAEFDSTPAGAWYFGLDAQTPAGQFDFVSVVLHELGHGLGFFGSGRVSGGLGAWGFSAPAGTTPAPTIYDRYVRAFGVPILSAPNPSTALATAFTTDNLFFQSPPTVSVPAISAPAKLFAPATFITGSSFSHLDEATYPAGNANALMTPAINSAEANHNPGPITGEIFTDSGWGATGGGTPPGIPTVTSASGTPGGTLTVTWTSGGGAAPTSHNLQFLQNGTILATTPHGPSTTFTFAPLPAGLVGAFQVRVQALSGASASAYSTLFNFTIGANPPGQPTVTSAGATGGTLTVNWTSGAGATPTGHRLDFSQGGVPLAQITTGAATTFSVGLPAGIQGTFAVQVTAFNGAIPGPASAPFTFTIGPACTVPTAPVVTGGIVNGNGSISWPAVAGATAYVVSAGTAPGGTQFLAPTNIGATTSVSASGLPAGFQAWVRVIAVNACAQQSTPTDFLLQ